MHNDKKEEEIRVPLPRLQKLAGKIPVFVPTHVLDQIKHLTNVIHTVEWSGVLFYSTKGDMNDVDNFKITLEWIYLMDKGSTGYTEYEPDEDLVGFMMDNPESLQWKKGHIHSHNNMGVFFSPTDKGEVQENSEFHNMYLSIITNNKLEFTAWAVFRGKADVGLTYDCKLVTGENYELTLEGGDEVAFYYECDLELIDKPQLADGFLARTTEIIEKKRVHQAKPVAKGQEIQKFNEKLDAKYGYGSERLHQDEIDAYNQSFNSEDAALAMQDWESAWEEDFPPYFVMMGALGSDDYTIDEALDTLNTRVDNNAMGDYINELIENAGELYTRYFIGGQTSIVDVFQKLEEIFTEFESLYPFLKDLNAGISIFNGELAKEG